MQRQFWWHFFYYTPSKLLLRERQKDASDLNWRCHAWRSAVLTWKKKNRDDTPNSLKLSIRHFAALKFDVKLLAGLFAQKYLSTASSGTFEREGNGSELSNVRETLKIETENRATTCNRSPTCASERKLSNSPVVSSTRLLVITTRITKHATFSQPSAANTISTCCADSGLPRRRPIEDNFSSRRPRDSAGNPRKILLPSSTGDGERERERESYWSTVAASDRRGEKRKEPEWRNNTCAGRSEEEVSSCVEPVRDERRAKRNYFFHFFSFFLFLFSFLVKKNWRKNQQVRTCVHSANWKVSIVPRGSKEYK